MRAVWALRSRRQLADAVVTIVSDEEVAAAIDGYASRVLELGAGGRSSVAAKASRRRPALLSCRFGLRGLGRVTREPARLGPRPLLGRLSSRVRMGEGL